LGGEERDPVAEREVQLLADQAGDRRGSTLDDLQVDLEAFGLEVTLLDRHVDGGHVEDRQDPQADLGLLDRTAAVRIGRGCLLFAAERTTARHGGEQRGKGDATDGHTADSSSHREHSPVGAVSSLRGSVATVNHSE
jgi:hypothetical protein